LSQTMIFPDPDIRAPRQRIVGRAANKARLVSSKLFL
jgi:hypothetical protein